MLSHTTEFYKNKKNIPSDYSLLIAVIDFGFFEIIHGTNNLYINIFMCVCVYMRLHIHILKHTNAK